GHEAIIGLERSSEGTYRLISNQWYNLWSLIRFTKQYPAPRILTNVAVVALIEKGFAPLHCAAVVRGNDGIALFAPPNTGKTYTTLRLIESGWKFVSEDVAITDGSQVFGCPYTGTLEQHNRRGLYAHIRNLEQTILK